MGTWTTVASGVAGRVDAFFNSAVLKRPRADLADPVQARERYAAIRDELCATHDRAAHTSEGFFPSPGSLYPLRRDQGRYGSARVAHLTWPSRPPRLFRRYGQLLDDHPGNAQGAAYYFRGSPAPRPIVMLIHGFLGGSRRFEPRLWPIGALMAQGLDVVLPVLPSHGTRHGTKGPPLWPGRDPRLRAEGFRQAMWDLQGLIAWLREQGHPHVGVMGMSLGGYTTALLATVDRSLDFAVPLIPLASFPDWTRDADHIGGSPKEAREIYDTLEDAHACFSPLRRDLVTPGRRVFVAGAERDGVTPLSHARRIAEHFDVPLVTFCGGHLLQLGRGVAFRGMTDMLRREAIL